MEWQINRGAKNCSHCDKLFVEEEEYCSALFDEDNEFARRDYCRDCWDKAQKENMFSFWKTRVPKKHEVVKKYADVNVFYDLFLKLEGDDSRSNINFRYVLSLYLMRKKVLKLKTIDKINGDEFLIFNNLKEESETKVLDPQLGKEEISTVTEEIGKLVNCTAK